MANSFTLPLRPLIEKGPPKDSLPIRIAQINAQRGSFRNVTEESLRAEIEARKSKEAAPEDEDARKESTEVDATERLDLLYKRRAEITQFALQAHMEAMFALDFISLLLSKHTPRQAELSMSPHLKQVAPVGSLSTDVIKTPQKSESAQQDKKAVSRGWKLESFNAAASKLLKSATRLEEEVAAETKYWGGVLTVKDKGWKVCRLPRERQALGVQYGFLEATSTFRDRGLASLRRADDGSLVLDKGLVPSKPRAVRVRVRQDSRITGCSRLPAESSLDSGSIEDRILQARDTLYEEELFHELGREARVMASQGATTRQNLIQFEVQEGQDIMLELVDLDQVWDEMDPQDRIHENDTLAQGIAHSVRILLSYAHRQNMRRRTQIPPPLTPKKRTVPEYQLLRPVAGYLQHSSHVRSLETFLKDVYRTLRSAGLECGYTATPFSSVKLSRDRNSASAVEGLVEEFLSPSESTFSGTLATPTGSFSVKVRTHMAPPSLGTDYEFSISLPGFPDIQPPARLGLRDEVEALITHLMTLDLVTFVSSLFPKRDPVPEEDDRPSDEEQGPGGPLTWEVAFPHHGELRAFSPATGRNKKMALKLSREELTLRTSWLSAFQELGGNEQDEHAADQFFYTWKAEDELAAAPGERKTLKDVVVEVSKEESPAPEH